ncbi:ski2-like helicase [Planctomycetes bacterium Poly30]|uniref:Ski2-like helicase n=1 Tax=Saltatorellus ferox TaxID=2528018 RepID=A0A518EUA5_9BACT|nr:ski2-like helicase [Planctomycetes bacterium Poly30]
MHDSPHDDPSAPSGGDQPLPFGHLPDDVPARPSAGRPAGSTEGRKRAPEARPTEKSSDRKPRAPENVPADVVDVVWPTSGREVGSGSRPAARSAQEALTSAAPAKRATSSEDRADEAANLLPAPTEVFGKDGRVVGWKGFKLSLFQLNAVDAIRQGRNVFVSAPTGAGKTLVAEYAIEDAVRSGNRCIYTAPIKALSNQKYRDFQNDPSIDVGLMTGDVTINPGGRVLIMTTEILRNAIFESPRLLQDVDYVIFDEVHYLDDRERGTVWEESLIFLPPKTRVIALSATVENVEELGGWIREIRPQDLDVIVDTKRPVPLSHWLHTENAGTVDASKADRVRKREAEIAAKEEAKNGGRRSSRRGSRRGRRGGRGGGRPMPPDPTALFDEIIERKMLPALVFSFSRKDCERLALKNANRRLLSPDEEIKMDALQEELIELFQLDRGHLKGEVFKLARAGVAYHHAGMLPIYKEVVERMFTRGLLKMLFTTETFALGINMPARAVVFAGLRKYDGISFDWLRTRDYMQMAGRAGRQGIDDKGFVFQLLAGGDVKDAPIERWIKGKPEPVTSRFRMNYSTLLHLVARIGRDNVSEAWEKSFHSYQNREKNKKARERQRRDQMRLISRHLDLLDELGYLDGDKVTAKGEIARRLGGYELQVTELLFNGAMETLPPRAIAMVFVAMIHEERRAAQRPWVPASMFGGTRRSIDNVMGDLLQAEARFGIDPPMKLPDWGLTPATLAWCGGMSMEELEEELAINPGDVCRVFRMAIQLMRNVKRSIDRDWDLAEHLDDAIESINRDEIDARKQLELG